VCFSWDRFNADVAIKSFVVIKVIVGVNLVGYATRRQYGVEARQAADDVNNFGRDPIGEGKEEQVRVVVHLCGLPVILRTILPIAL